MHIKSFSELDGHVQQLSLQRQKLRPRPLMMPAAYTDETFKNRRNFNRSRPLNFKIYRDVKGKIDLTFTAWAEDTEGKKGINLRCLSARILLV